MSLLRCSSWKSRSPLRPGDGGSSATVLGAEALHRRPGLDQRAVDREVLVRQERLHLWVGAAPRQELGRHVGLQQPVAVLGEHRVVPHRIVHPEPHEPAVEQVVVELLHQQPLGADREERLQQSRPQQPLRRDRIPSRVRVELVELRIQARQTSLTMLPDRTQRMPRRHPRLDVHVREQLPRLLVRAPHPRPLASRRRDGIIFARRCQQRRISTAC